MKIGISSCLIGNKVRYDGKDKKNKELMKLLEGQDLIPICPEIEAGFSVPREPIEMKDGHIIKEDLTDLTEELRKGSLHCLRQIEGCDFLILKSKSPSCGMGKIYDGSFTGKLIDGNGLFTSSAKEKGYRIFTEDQLEEIKGVLKEGTL